MLSITVCVIHVDQYVIFSSPHRRGCSSHVGDLGVGQCGYCSSCLVGVLFSFYLLYVSVSSQAVRVCDFTAADP